MITLDFTNVQELVFKDADLQLLLIECQSLFHQWKLGQNIPSLRPMGQKAVLDFLNRLTSEQIKVLENYWKDSVKIERLDYALIKNYELKISESEQINNLNVDGEIVLYRDASTLYISSWK